MNLYPGTVLEPRSDYRQSCYYLRIIIVSPGQYEDATFKQPSISFYTHWTKSVALLFRIQEVLGSNLGADTGNHNRFFIVFFSSSRKTPESLFSFCFDHFLLSTPFQYIFHQLPYGCIMWSIVIVIEVNFIVLTIHDFSISLDTLIKSEVEMAFKWRTGQCCWLELNLMRLKDLTYV